MRNQINVPEHFKYNYKSTLHYYNLVKNHSLKISPESWQNEQRRLAKTDLFFLLVFICKRYDINRKWLFERCREVQANPNGYLDLWARGHYKSTLITFGMTLFDIINNPEITIGIFSHTKAIAKDFVKQIKTEIENNHDLYRLFPDIFHENPSSKSGKWSEDAIRVKRKTNPKEETVEACGLVDGMPTGKHFKVRIYDDIVTMDSVKTPEQIQKTTESWQMSDNLGTGSDDDIVRYIGTRYHLFDSYSVMIDNDSVIPRLHPATKDGTEYGEPVLLSQDEIDSKRKLQGPFVFGSQMLLNPVADKSMGFDNAWLVKSDTDYNAAMSSLWRFIIVDPASRKPHSKSNARRNDYTSFWVIGHGRDRKYRVLDIVRDKLNLTKRADTLIDLHRKWKPGLVAYEDYGMQADIEHIKYVQEQKLYEFDITPIAGSMKKELRILRLVPLFENGYKSVQDGGDGIAKSRIILPTTHNYIDYEGRNRDLVKDFIEQEYTAFPVLKHDDMLDCLARIVDLENMNLIEIPSIESPETKTQRINDILGNIGQKGNESWLTV